MEAVTFRISKETIQKILSGEADSENLADMLDNLYILSTLQEES